MTIEEVGRPDPLACPPLAPALIDMGPALPLEEEPVALAPTEIKVERSALQIPRQAVQGQEVQIQIKKAVPLS